MSTDAKRDAAIAQFQKTIPDERIAYVGHLTPQPVASRVSPTDNRTLPSAIHRFA